MKVTIQCTDNGKQVEAEINNHREKKFLEVYINTVKVVMKYEPKTDIYVGSMAGLEFTVKSSEVPEEYHYKEYRR